MAERDDTGRFRSSRPNEIERAEIAEAAGLRGSFGGRLKGDTAAEMQADAQVLAQEMGVAAPAAAQDSSSVEPSGDWLKQALTRSRQGPAVEPGPPSGDWVKQAVARSRQRSAPAEPAPDPPPAAGGFDQGARGGALGSRPQKDWLGKALRREE